MLRQHVCGSMEPYRSSACMQRVLAACQTGNIAPSALSDIHSKNICVACLPALNQSVRMPEEAAVMFACEAARLATGWSSGLPVYCRLDFAVFYITNGWACVWPRTYDFKE